MADPLVLSSSSVATFLRCGQQWWYSYVEAIKSPPNVRQVIGIATHRAIEVNMAQKVDSLKDLPLDEVKDAFNDSYDEEIYGWEASDDPETPEKGKSSGLKLIELARDRVLPRIQPLAVEMPVQMTVKASPEDNATIYSGVLDLVDTKGRVHDWKTTKRRPTNTAGLHILQMTGYALGYRIESGQQETEVVLDHFIRTQTPSYLPVASGGPVGTGAINTFVKIVSDVRAQIEAGRFLPNGLMSGACSWCGYTNICPAYKEFRQKGTEE
jgi:CRISPR/Cas system-associated exonuclease Cas4 (RecB family)